MNKTAESEDGFQKPLEARPKKPVRKSIKNGLHMEYTSSKLSPKEKSGIENVHEPPNTGNCVSNSDLSMDHENLKPHQDLDNGFEYNEDFKTQESNWDSYSSSSMADCDRFDEETADARDESHQMLQIPRSWESSPNAEPGTWIEIGRLPPMMVRTIVSVLYEKLEKNEDLEYEMIRHLIATKNTIIDKLIRAGNCDELATSTKQKHAQLAGSGDPFNLDELPTLGEIEQCAEVAKNILNDAEQLMENVKKLTDDAKNLLDAAENLRDIDTKMLENSEKSMDDVEKMINYASKLIGIGEKLIKKGEKLSDIVMKWEENLSDWNEDRENKSSFPTFLAKFLLIMALFAVLVVPALFAK